MSDTTKTTKTGKKDKDLYYETWDVSPEDAEQYLSLNTQANRPVSLVKVDRLAQDILAGRWQVTHESLAFDREGNLLDGQHRLHAVVKAKKTVRFWVALNCDAETFRVINSSGGRSSDDLFVIMFKQRYGNAPARSKYVSSVACGMLARRGRHVEREAAAEHALKHYKLINQMLPTTMKHQGIVTTHTAAAFANAALYYGLERAGPLAERFASGVWASATDPLKALHDKFVRAATSNDRRAAGLTRGERYGMTVAAIRAALLGVPRSKLTGSAQDFGEAEVDKRIRAGEKIDARSFREVEVADEPKESRAAKTLA